MNGIDLQTNDLILQMFNILIWKVINPNSFNIKWALDIPNGTLIRSL